MKRKEKKQLIGKAASELHAEVKKLRTELVNLRLDQMQGKLKDTSSLTNKRKEIAIIKTALREKEMNNENV